MTTKTKSKTKPKSKAKAKTKAKLVVAKTTQKKFVDSQTFIIVLCCFILIAVFLLFY